MKKLNNLIRQLSNPFILMGVFNGYNIMRIKKNNIQEARPSKKSSVTTIYAAIVKSQCHLDPSLGIFSTIDLTLSDPSIFIYNWRVYKASCGSDHYPIIMENMIIKKKIRSANNSQTLTMDF